MSGTILMCGDGGVLASALRERIAASADVQPWAFGQPVPTGASAAIDIHVVDAEAKAAALAQLDAQLPRDAPILSCCHAATVTGLSATARYPDRFTGFALLPPFEGRTMVECSRGLQTGDPATRSAEAIWRAAGLEPVWVGDAAGLVTPRVVACLANEAAFAVMERAASPEDVDRAMELGTAYPRGPLAWAALVGLPHIVAILDGLAREHGDDRYRVAPLLRKMALAGRSDWTPAP
jgi:3-hydroxybutyryl-CoA dehydrogenase